MGTLGREPTLGGLGGAGLVGPLLPVPERLCAEAVIVTKEQRRITSGLFMAGSRLAFRRLYGENSGVNRRYFAIQARENR